MFLTLAFRNVIRNRERSILTLIGVLLAVGAFVALVSLASGLYKRVRIEMDARDVDIYILPDTAMALPSGPIGTLGYTSDTIHKDFISAIAQLNNVAKVGGVIRQTWTGKHSRFPVLALEPELVTSFFPYLRFEEGMLMQDDEVMIGIGLARSEYGRSDQVTSLSYGQKTFSVAAIVAGGGFQDYFAYIPLNTAMRESNAEGVDEIWIQLHDKHNPYEVIKHLRELRLEDGRALEHVQILTKKQYLGAANDFIKLAWLLQLAIASIGVLIAITASMNTMLMSTYERLREFSTLRAIGASRLTVVAMIVSESVMLSCAGGGLGTLFGWIASGVLDKAVVVLLQLPFPLAEVTPSLLLEAAGLSVTVGVIGAAIPSFIVWKLNIVDALRLD